MAPSNSGEGSMAVEQPSISDGQPPILRICIGKTGLDTLQFRDIIALHTALLEGGGQECAEAE